MANLGFYAPKGYVGQDNEILVLAAGTVFNVANTNNLSSIIGIEPGRFSGFTLFYNISAISGVSAALTVTAFQIDPITGSQVAFSTPVVGAAQVATGEFELVVYPHNHVVSHVAFVGGIPSRLQFQFFVSNTTTPSVTLSAALVLVS